METPFHDLPKGNFAYIRLVALKDLPNEIRAQLPNNAAVWGVHDANGECLALAQNRNDAFMLARDNDLAPLSVH